MIIRFFYSVLLIIIAPVFLFGLFRKKTGKPSVGARWKEHFGFTPPLKTMKSPIWFHAVSVGEMMAVTPLIKRYKQQHPEAAILITTTTPTGAEQAEKLSSIAEHRYMPLDFSFAINQFIQTIHPSQLLIMETELWPNTLHTLAKHHIPVSIINARLSNRACQRYKKILPLFRVIEPCLTRVLCQTQQDEDNFAQLGVSKAKLKVTGSIKFDLQISNDILTKGTDLRQQLGNGRQVWIAASTHQGEDEKILKAHQTIIKQIPDALLILVPRHPERFDDVYKLCCQSFLTKRRSLASSGKLSRETQVYLGDSMGELLILIQASDLCLMGGSFLGNKVGGHNVLEPATLNVPILIGPSYFNFKDIVDNLVQRTAINIVKNEQDIASSVIHLMTSKNLQHTMSKNARQFIAENTGAIDRTLQNINEKSENVNEETGCRS
ncbi:lipid IV(A) 3-deoxy-D-manno-octulosonic acid transferase [Vibrio salinus]|uniref:lipid IV(A) 3-deoxy-D-manno-octulosonic acid transferase n=1 Tax=Vibrio salinus TaxID=2899784 RepID=UPI001E5B2C88|nr:lipid IV(A) 3-deoxy-D-manno-octulosonic acid transferase [Vibrio salinus]MCE0493752.1 lipid IV(A) 3-deoxy-D-manno-octulosonic acid transferase [Vibrio salinus]